MLHYRPRIPRPIHNTKCNAHCAIHNTHCVIHIHSQYKMQYTLCNTHAFTIQDTMVIAHCIALLAEICYIHTNMLRRSRQRCRQIFLRQNRLLSCQTPTPRIWTLWVMRTLQPPLLLVSSKTLHAMQCTLYTCCALYLNIVHCSHAMLCLYTFGNLSVNYNSAGIYWKHP